MEKWIRSKIVSICEKMKFRRRLKRMDAFWNLYGGSCFGLFPPSFYYKHSEEEIRRIQQEEIAKLQEIINDFVKQNEGKI